MIKKYCEKKYCTKKTDYIFSGDKKYIYFALIGPININVNDYIQRVMKHLRCEKECYIIGLVLLEKITEKLGQKINGNMFYKIFAISMYISVKMHDDNSYNDKYYCTIFGLKKNDIVNLTYLFMETLDYNLLVKKEEYDNKLLEVMLESENNLFEIVI